MLWIAPATQPGFLLLGVRRLQKDQQRIGLLADHLAGPLDVDLQDDVSTTGRLQRRGAVVVADELGVLQKPTVVDPFLELLFGHEDIGVLGFGRPPLTSGPRPAQPELGVALDKNIDDRALADASRPGNDDQ